MVFLVSTFTQKGLAVNHSGKIITANSKEEAVGIALANLDETHPLADGWGQRDAVASEFSKEELERLKVYARYEKDIQTEN